MATSEVISLPRVRLSFQRLYEARAFEKGQEPRFEATFLLDPSNEVHAEKIKELRRTAARLVKEVCDGKIPEDVRYCFGKGDTKKYDGYAGMWYIATHKKASDGRVTVVDQNKNPVQAGEENAPYSGCYVNATITLWSQNNRYGRRVNCNLRAVQFAKKGEAFTAVKPVDMDTEFEDFADFEDDFEDDDFDDGADDADIPF